MIYNGINKDGKGLCIIEERLKIIYIERDDLPMKQIICKVEYDTETAEVVASYTSGEFGDATGYEEILYVTPTGKYFLYTNGGAESIYPKEKITRMSEAKAKEWKAAH